MKFIIFIFFICKILNADQTLKIQETPDFCQADTQYGILPKYGASHCAPVAISNLLIYLNKNGFYNLTNTKTPTNYDQFKLINELGNYMHTNTSGTKPNNLASNSTLQLKSGQKTSSQGYFELDCLQIKNGNDLAIIDGAIAFSIEK